MFDRTPVPPQVDDPDVLLRHIAAMADCHACFPEGYEQPNGQGGHLPVERSRFCSKHRDPILLALGYVNGWTHRGGVPQKFTTEE